MTTHIMLDIETWGRTPGSDIRSIGAVVFDPMQPGGNRFNKPEMQFYIACYNPKGRWRKGDFVEELARNENERLYPLTREPETIQWWSEQSPEAQAAFTNPVDMRDALIQFAIWVESVSELGPPVPRYPDAVAEGVRLWANDPQFDISILEVAYQVVQLPYPWHYRAPRSFRTVVELSGMTSEDKRQFDTGTAHNALDDAISQAKIVCEAYKRLGLSK